MKKVLHVLISDYEVDSRVRNETESLLKFYNVEVLCLKGKSSNNDGIRKGVKLTRLGLNFKNKMLKYLTAYFAMFFYSLTKKYSVVHAHDMNALPVAFLIAKIKRVPLVYDSHELWSESLHGNHPKWLLAIVQNVEVKLAHKANHVITVSESISNYLKTHFQNPNVSVVRNVPSYIHDSSYNYFRENLPISESTPIFLYQGLISEARGVKMLLNAILELPKDLSFSFVFLGDGPFKEELGELIIKYNLSDKVFNLKGVSQNILLKYTSSADIGVHALDNSCLNHEYCLPNKVFEYLNAGIGLICPDLIELSKFIESEKVGSTFKCGDKSALSQEIEKYAVNQSLIVSAKQAALESRKTLNWASEEQYLLDVYKKVDC